MPEDMWGDMNYKMKNLKEYTNKQKYNHIYRYWRKQDLLNIIEDYLVDINCPEEDWQTYLDITKNLKTKKAILNKYLDLVWDIILEEYSYAY